ncbi:MAG: GntR family transcriptional regulator [Betaproteobacteria bacterium]|nr:GntR family transcriptional regulator [Betaproteobacteria bacterium]
MNHPAPTFSPLYRQIKGLIMQSLESGEWRPGEAIPSEIELAARYKVSQGTVRKAIDELAAENYLLRRQGKGTFVATHDEARAQFRFLRLMPDEGKQEYAASRFLDCKRARASAEISRLLELRAGDSVVVIRRVLDFAGEPTVFEQIYLPGTLFRDLSAAIFNEYKGSMYKLFETEFGTRMIRAEEKIRAVAADATAAELLRVPRDTPLLCVERVAFSYGEKPVEFRRGYYRTDRHYYKNELG